MVIRPCVGKPQGLGVSPDAGRFRPGMLRKDDDAETHASTLVSRCGASERRPRPPVGAAAARRRHTLVNMPIRRAVRAVFVDESEAVFLMRIVEPSSKQGWWITPGGAIDADES